MTLEPLSTKAAAQAAVKVVTEDEARNKFLGFMLGIIITIVIIIAIPVYIASHPLSFFADILGFNTPDTNTIEGFKLNNDQLIFPDMGLNIQYAQLSPEVLAYKDAVTTECAAQGVSADYVGVILGIMQQESGGRLPDVMQSSESIGLPPNTITDPLLSIKHGVQHYKNCLERAKNDMDISIQTYNYGLGFADYALQHGGKWTMQLASDFSDEQATKLGWNSYGDKQYVPHVKRYIVFDSTIGDEKFKIMMAEVLKYQGTPYVWAGDNPQTGFDCSGLTQWAYKTVGISLPRTAETQFEYLEKIPLEQAQLGDLIFFQNTYKPGVSHVGIFVGNNQMFHAGDPLGFANITTSYWREHFAGVGRFVQSK